MTSPDGFIVDSAWKAILMQSAVSKIRHITSTSIEQDKTTALRAGVCFHRLGRSAQLHSSSFQLMHANTMWRSAFKFLCVRMRVVQARHGSTWLHDLHLCIIQKQHAEAPPSHSSSETASPSAAAAAADYCTASNSKKPNPLATCETVFFIKLFDGKQPFAKTGSGQT